MGDYFDVGKCKDDVVYTTHIAPILEHNQLILNLNTLRERGNYRERGFLVSVAVGTRFAGRSPAVTQC